MGEEVGCSCSIAAVKHQTCASSLCSKAEVAVPGTVTGPSWPPGSHRQKSVGEPVLATVVDEAASPLKDTAGYQALVYVQFYGTGLTAAGG